MSIRDLNALVFHVRETSAGRSDLLRATYPERIETLSTTDFVRSVHSLALALEARGLEKGERVGLYCENRPDWHVVDLACQLLGAPTVPMLPSLSQEQLSFVLRNSGCRWVFYSDPAKGQVLIRASRGLSAPPSLVTLDPLPAEREAAEGTGDGRPSVPGPPVPGSPDAVSAGPSAAGRGGESAASEEARQTDAADRPANPPTTLTRLLGEGAARLGAVPIERFRDRVDEDDLASILYTSGTTDDPKGVMLSHGNFVSNILACAEIFPVGPRDRALSFLPLAHVFQRTVDYLCLYRGTPIHYVPFFDDVPEVLRSERPTVMAAAPAVYELAHRRAMGRIESLAPVRARLARWALAVGKRHAVASREGLIGPLLAFRRLLADRLVLRELRAQLGGRMRLAISGGAPLAPEAESFFEAIGIPLFQGYGLTETSPVLSANRPEDVRPGSVGKPISDVELRIAEDGEILVRGPGIMQGYWQNEAATAAARNESGWFRTGDLGRMDQSGYVFVTDRKRHLLSLSTGETVAPRPIERLLTGHRLFSQAVVVGEGRPRLAALLFADTGDAAASEPGAKDAEPFESAAREWVAEVNAQLPEALRLESFAVVLGPLTQEAGELTPTLELRRRVVRQRYAAQIARLYEAESPADPRS